MIFLNLSPLVFGKSFHFQIILAEDISQNIRMHLRILQNSISFIVNNIRRHMKLYYFVAKDADGNSNYE